MKRWLLGFEHEFLKINSKLKFALIEDLVLNCFQTNGVLNENKKVVKPKYSTVDTSARALKYSYRSNAVQKANDSRSHQNKINELDRLNYIMASRGVPRRWTYWGLRHVISDPFEAELPKLDQLMQFQ